MRLSLAIPEYATRPIGDPPQWNLTCSSCRDRHFVRLHCFAPMKQSMGRTDAALAA
jgi:hypothetical protein